MNYAKILLPRRRPERLPDRELTRTVEVDRGHLAAYDRVCGFRLRDRLPATYPHVLAFPLAIDLMTASDFPFGVLGLVHVANRIEQDRPLDAGEPIELRVRAADLRPHERGRQFDLVAEAGSWRSRSTYLKIENGGGGSKRQAEPPPMKAVWRVPGDIGRRYAGVSGDRNPIHLHPLPAKLLGQPGAIAHGMWSYARALASLGGRLPDRHTSTGEFGAPLRIPGRAVLRSLRRKGGWDLALESPDRSRRHLELSVEA
jgi:hypothetical protein